jgi:hypothetical protein
MYKLYIRGKTPKICMYFLSLIGSGSGYILRLANPRGGGLRDLTSGEFHDQEDAK